MSASTTTAERIERVLASEFRGRRGGARARVGAQTRVEAEAFLSAYAEKRFTINPKDAEEA